MILAVKTFMTIVFLMLTLPNKRADVLQYRRNLKNQLKYNKVTYGITIQCVLDCTRHKLSLSKMHFVKKYGEGN